MSLLNDALKRAETDKSSNTFDPSSQLPELVSADEDGGGGKFRLPALVALMLGLAAAAAWYFTHTGEDAVPAAASADPVAAQPAPTEPPAPPAAFVNRPRRAAPADVPAVTPPLASAQEDKPQAAPVPDKMPPPEALGDERPLPGPALAKADVRTPAGEPTDELPRADAAPAPAKPAEPAGNDTPAPAPAAQEEAKPAADAPADDEPAKPAPKPARKPKPDASKFDLSGIMEGPDGKTAIINGVFVTVGQSVDGATVTAIGAQTAELEMDGHKIRLRFGAD